MTEKPLLALSMIVKNEADSIQNVLMSCYGVVDYAYILDTGSTDGTQSLALDTLNKLGIPGRIEQGVFDGFAATRNRALEKSEKEAQFSLILSGDEYLQDTATLRYALQNLPDRDVFSLITKLTFSGIVNTIPRIIRSGQGIRYVGRIHEELVGYKSAAHIPTMVIHDDRYMSDPEKKKNRYLRDKSMILEAIEKGERVPIMLEYLFNTMYLLGEYQEIVDFSKKYRKQLIPKSHRPVMQSKLKLGLDAREDFDIAIQDLSIAKHVMYDFALHLHREGKHGEAIQYALFCSDPSIPNSVQAGWTELAMITWKPHWLVSSIAAALGEKELALKAGACAVLESNEDPRIVSLVEKLVDREALQAILHQVKNSDLPESKPS